MTVHGGACNIIRRTNSNSSQINIREVIRSDLWLSPSSAAAVIVSIAQKQQPEEDITELVSGLVYILLTDRSKLAAYQLRMAEAS